jgi:ferredoxin, 2Fe-2S
MITLKFIASSRSSDEVCTEIQCEPGISVMQAAVNANLGGIEADCGGLLSCATCHVVVPAPWLQQLPAAQADELSMLEFTATPRTPNSRLSCQIMLTQSLDGLTLELPPSQH